MSDANSLSIWHQRCGVLQGSSPHHHSAPEVLNYFKWNWYNSLCSLHIHINTLTQLPDSIRDAGSALTQLSLKGCSSLEGLPACLAGFKLEVRAVPATWGKHQG